MSPTKLLLIGSLTLFSAACVSHTQADDGFAKVTVRELANSPDYWDERRVTVSGWLVRDFENFNLYDSRQAACGLQDKVVAVGASFGTIISYGTMRRGTFRGTFRFGVWKVYPNGDLIINTGYAGPGPLEIDDVISWTSRAEPACR